MGLSEGLLTNIAECKLALERGEYPDLTKLDYVINQYENEYKELEKSFDECDERRKFFKAQVQQQYGIIDSLSEEFASIYVIPVDNRELVIPIKRQMHSDVVMEEIDRGWGYAEMIEHFIINSVHPDDRDMMRKVMVYDNLYNILKEHVRYYHHFRMQVGEEIHYYYIKATRVASGAAIMDAIMIGFVCEDESKERETFRTLSETDIMTKLYNRGTGEKKTGKILDSGINGLFCMMDIDHFKSINDTFGHSVGDDVITAFSDLLKGAFREDDIVFRLGGDEFAVFAPGIQSRRVGMRILRNFIKQLENLTVPGTDGRYIEASIGALITGGNYIKFEDVYNKADAGVYISKKTRGNTITFDPDEKPILIPHLDKAREVQYLSER